MNTEKYLESWQDTVKSSANYDEYVDYTDVYNEIAGYLADQIKVRRLPRSTAVNMCFSLLVNQIAQSGVCPACEFFAASEAIHDEMGCPDVH